ncbi:hypothetical protein GCM10009584_20040 [Ornithinimicrobium humiphilum]
MAAHLHRSATAPDHDREPAIEKRRACAHDPEAARQDAGVSAAVTSTAPGDPGCKRNLEGGDPSQTNGQSTTFQGAPLTLST